MKKTLLFIAAILISLPVFAQTKSVLLEEHFNTASIPTGWNVMGLGTSNWKLSNSNNAGGSPREILLDWTPQFNGTTRLVMPAIDLTGYSHVAINFKHCFDNYSGSQTIGVATTSDNGTTWNIGWQQSYNTDGVYEVLQEISTPDIGNSSVRFCLFYTGNSYNYDAWYFDDFEIFSMDELNVSLNSIDIHNKVGVVCPRYIPFTITNKGTNTIEQLTAMYQIDENEPVEQTFSMNLSSLATTQLTFDEPQNLFMGEYTIRVRILAINGTSVSPEDSSLEKTFEVFLGEAQRIPMIEHFSSSTCGPCVSVNNAMLVFTNNNQGKFTYTKYQMNWPGSGDPYYTSEGGTRRQYYNVNAVPMCYLDGTLQSGAVSQYGFDKDFNTPALTDVRGSFSVEGTTITAKIDFMSFIDISSIKLYATVNEKVTTGNVGGNGETSFHHIFMKFLTSPSGTFTSFTEGEVKHYEYTFDMASTHVEEMTDLEVAAWMQINGTKETYNSHFLYEYTDIHPYPVQNLALTLEDNTLTATWEAPEGDHAMSYNVFLNGILVENTTATTYETTVESENNIVAVQALYANDMTSVKMVKKTETAPMSMGESISNSYSIYPNPTNDDIMVSGDNISMVEVYNLCGQKMISIDAESSNVNVKMSQLKSGLYMVKIVDNNGNETVNKVVKR